VGVYQAATAAPGGRQVWVIGVDTDQYLAVANDPANQDWQEWQPHILTSVLKRTDVGVYQALTTYSRNQALPPLVRLDLAAQGVDLATSGGFIDDLKSTLDSWRARIASGAVVVPCIPDDRVDAARAAGFGATACDE
jgi:basic membrane protein A